MRKILLFTLLTAFSCLAMAQPEIKGNPEDLRQFLHPGDKIVSLYAEAEEKAYSDKAVISLVVTTEDKLLSDSLAQNSRLRQRITEQLVAAGIDRENIKSSKFSTSPQYGWFGRKPNSYKVVNRMAVSIFEETQLQEIAAVADSNKEVELSDTTFEHTKKEELEHLVEEQALAKVNKQRAFYEKNLGIRLTPIGLRKANIGHGGTHGAVMLEEVVVTASRKSGAYQGGSRGADAYEPPLRQEPSFDEVQYKAGIYVDFKIDGNGK
ncbi:DUF541 domain-containing protein [Exilibacterium tricleocarpae]|uniref:DUF541 domain-containing protein n=1 Tax=Exilibacterium tricleocarpae TaxID=2591008 RepID=A0A545T681_9GAMM|nr:SIMPL domain-containing protein [Exilibacterium tricleocarpae]TQV72672.1 DUF541 domain-containing protein [Exilibacterium tricleocarpae]